MKNIASSLYVGFAIAGWTVALAMQNGMLAIASGIFAIASVIGKD